MIIGAVIPALVGALAGFLVGASAAGYWVVALLAAVGAFLSGFEHAGGWDAADRGFFGGVIYGTCLLLVHELIHNRPRCRWGASRRSSSSSPPWPGRCFGRGRTGGASSARPGRQARTGVALSSRLA